jgi:tetratricopeptide (TPR) repeat protein
MLFNGCAHKAKTVKSTPQQVPPPFNFKSTPKEEAKLFQRLGQGFFQQKDWEMAKIYFGKAVQSDSKLYMSWYYLGLLNIDNPSGYDYLNKSVAIKSDFPAPYYWMAYYNCRMKEDQKAIQLFKEYIETAKGRPGEEDRLQAAKEALEELQSGKEGKVLTMIRNPPGG